MKQRIWELDALRGMMIWGVVAIHLIFDLNAFLGIDVIKHPVLQYCVDRCGFLFVILSGVSVTLGRRSIRRGLQVFGCGMLITAVTGGMYLLGMADRWLIIWFGVLHLIGTCMLLWPLLRSMPSWSLAVMGILSIALGHVLRQLTVSFWWLTPLGLCTADFVSADYFPLFPHLGWFLLGACLGRWLYREKKSLLPQYDGSSLPMRFFRFCGRHSLWIYLIHQPVLYGVILLISGS